MATIKEPVEFDWSKGNIGKNEKHKVSDKETEEVFFDKTKVIYRDVFHSEKEDRYILLGKTKKGRLLYIAFTFRGKRKERVRVISARDINKKEVKFYRK